MNVSYQWLRAVAPGLDLTPAEVAERLALRGAPVEEMVDLGEPFADLVVGRVVRSGRHPDADRLSLCQVDAGGDEPVQVVCGAPNVEEGAFYPFAPVGAQLPGGVKIKKVKIRGVHSVGMLCSERELGLGRDHTGILKLGGDLRPGQPLTEALALNDVRMDVEVSPNRGDLLSHRGVARELVPGGDASLAPLAVPGTAAFEADLKSDKEEVESGGFRLRVEDGDLCYRFLAVVIRGVRVGPSPDWLANRLRAVASQPINNVVDATNYVMLEVGHPMHAYDLARLKGPALIARRAGPDERIVTLDGVTRPLTPDMLAICDEAGPAGIGGVMGGADSEVSEATTDILLEAALFHPPSVRATRRALDLSTEASYRFERGVDPEFHETAIRHATELIVAVAGGTPDNAVLDVCPRPWREATVSLRPSRVTHVLGVPFEAKTIKSLLAPLGFGVDASDPELLSVTVPGYRSYDVTREVDLIEEVARAYGFDAFPDELGSFRPGTVPDHPLFQLEDDLRGLLVGRGFLEAQTPAFTAASEGEVEIINPISNNDTHMRISILPTLARRVSYNFARGNRTVRLFELGTSFRAGPNGDPPLEEPHLAVVVTGLRAPPHWSEEARETDIWDVKALAEEVTAAAYPGGSVVPAAEPHPSVVSSTALLLLDAEGSPVGIAGGLPDHLLDAPAWAGPVFGLEMSLPPVPEEAAPTLAEHLPAFPGIDRDLALLVPRGVSAAEIQESIEAAASRLLAGVVVFDLYEGEELPPGVRSVAYRLRFQSPDRTLTDQEVERATNRILERVKEEMGVEARG